VLRRVELLAGRIELLNAVALQDRDQLRVDELHALREVLLALLR
jgi:hypothetical protein